MPASCRSGTTSLLLRPEHKIPPVAPMGFCFGTNARLGALGKQSAAHPYPVLGWLPQGS
jgi:hypothetical protein